LILILKITFHDIIPSFKSNRNSYYSIISKRKYVINETFTSVKNELIGPDTKMDKTTPEYMKDQKWMAKAVSLAEEAAIQGEVPVGAVLVKNDVLIAEGSNSPIKDNDPTAHAEIAALRQGAKILENYRLPGTTLYVTLEPCIMCMGAIIHARIERLVIGATDPKSGAAFSVYNIGNDNLLNHSIVIHKGICEDECRELLKRFFKSRREARKNDRKK
jgi:tRNA(adenine34) deaminase